MLNRQSVELGGLDAAQQALQPPQHPGCFTKAGGGSGAAGTLQGVT